MTSFKVFWATFAENPVLRRTRPWSQSLCRRATKTVDARLGVRPRTWGHGNIAYAGLPDRIGYLRISAFAEYAGPGSSIPADRKELSRSLRGPRTRLFTVAASRS